MKKRTSNIELLRIICMIMIVALHSLGFTGLLSTYRDFSFNSSVIWLLEAFCFVAVNCYVLISAYFMCDKKISLKKIVKIWTQVFFYSVILLLISILLGNEVSKKEIIKCIFPFSTKNYWFPAVYLLLTLLSPILNILISKLKKGQFRYLLIINAIAFSIIPYAFQVSDNFDFGGGYGIVWFVNLYLVAGYLKKYVNKEKIKKRYCVLTYLLCCISTYLIFIVIQTTKIPFFSPDFFYTYPFILVLIASISLFIIFINIDIKNEKINKIILKLSSLTFGVYLIHEHPLIRTMLWENIGPYLIDFSIIKLIVTISLVYIACSAIEALRQVLFTPLNRIIEKNKKIDGFNKKINEVLYEKS